MTDPSDPRLYGEKEIGRILKRATELQHDEPTAPSADGMSLRELEEIAAEAGIDPRFLRRAAVELESGVDDSSFWARAAGDALMLVRETRVPGEMPDDGFERVVNMVQRVTREHGQPSLLGRTLTWRAETPNKTRTVQLTVTSRDGHTDVRVEENLHQFAGGLFGGIMGGAGGGVGLGFGLGFGLEVLGSALFAVAFPLGTLGLTYIASREIYHAVVKRRRRAMGEVFEQVVAEVTACISAATVSPPEEPRELLPG